MAVTGIIAEFNPLHKGHEYLIRRAAEDGPVICVLSGNFVQRGDTAIAEKQIRAAAALAAGADAVIELPVIWSMSTAQNFALGGVSAAVFAGCDNLMFGSEWGDTGALLKACDILQSEEFSEKLEKHLATGITFAAARQKAAEECGAEKGILKNPNNNLAVEYITAARRLESDINFRTVKRVGTGHDSGVSGGFASASYLREKLLSGDRQICLKYMSKNMLDLFTGEALSDIYRLETAILCALRGRTPEELGLLPDLSEGVENKLYMKIKVATDLEGLYNSLKVKRYTLARIRRLVLSAFLGIDGTFFMKPLPYLRILGFSPAGKEVLKQAVKNSPVPIIMRVGQIKGLSKEAAKVFETECRATDIYTLSLKNPLKCGLEYTRKLIKTE